MRKASPLCQTVENIIDRAKEGPFKSRLGEEEVRYVVQLTLLEMGNYVSSLYSQNPRHALAAVRRMMAKLRRCTSNLHGNQLGGNYMRRRRTAEELVV